MPGIAHRVILDTPLAVVDLETTGLYPGGDRIVELAVVRVEPGSPPHLVLDTLVNPRRPVSATEIHGITDADVADAPTFDEVAGNLVAALQDCIFGSYNVYFDLRFVQAELASVGVSRFPPHLCLMYLRPLLGVGSRCSLADACRCHGIEHTTTHWAGEDALAAARLWQTYRATFERLALRTFADLAGQKAYKFMKSFELEPYDELARGALTLACRLKSRGQREGIRVTRQGLIGEYWDALTAALADLQVTEHEIEYLLSKRTSLGLSAEELRWLHARAFAGILADVCQDKAVTPSEADALHRVSLALGRLGWAPGDPVELQARA